MTAQHQADLFSTAAIATERSYRNGDAAGHRGVETSIAAADEINNKLSRLQAMAFDAIRDAGASGLTADELADHLGMDRYSIQPRTSELRLKRMIADSGLRRPNATGKRAIVWTTRDHVREPGQ